MQNKIWSRIKSALSSLYCATLKQWHQDLKRIPEIDIKWLAIWMIIFVGFVYCDIFAPHLPETNLLKYIGIFLCIIYARQKYREDIFLQLALLLTFAADTILVWTTYYVAGVYIFCFAQFMHILRQSNIKLEVVFTYAATISVMFAYAVMRGIEPIYAIAAIYAIELGINLILSLKRYITKRKDFRARCAFYGFIAFICCDTCVALRFIALQGMLTPKILPLVSFLVWVFYYPSQVLLANSSTIKPTPAKLQNKPL